MTRQDLFEAFNGQYIEIAGTSARNQCVDLANSYIKYVLRLPVIEYTNAVDFPSKVSSADYDYILNTPTGVPVEGDLVIWGGTYGHIAIFIEGDANQFTSFDENYPTGSPCHVQSHNYTSPQVLGWLHPKNPPPSLDQELQKCVNDRNSHWDWLTKVADKLHVPVNIDIILSELDKFISYEDKLVEKDTQLHEAQESIADLSVKVEELTREKNDLSTAITEAQTLNKTQAETLKEQSDRLALQEETIKMLGGEIENIRQELRDALNKTISGWTWFELVRAGIERLFGIRR